MSFLKGSKLKVKSPPPEVTAPEVIVPPPPPTVPARVPVVVKKADAPKKYDAKVLTAPGGRPMRVAVQTFEEGTKHDPNLLVKFTAGLTVNGCSFATGDLAVLPVEVAAAWGVFLTVL